MPATRSAPRVHKFGGAALADANGIRRVAEIVRTQPRPAVVVVSALGGVTDALFQGATAAGRGDERIMLDVARTLRQRHRAVATELLSKAGTRTPVLEAIDASMDELEQLAHGLAILRELTPRTTDHIVARGERLSAAIVAAALIAAGVRARVVDACAVVKTDGHFGGASPDLARTDRAARAALRPLLTRGVVAVIPGFIGETPDGQTATLGRGGSDLTATVLGRALRAVEVNLWKDVPGLLTADPREVSDARVIPQLNAREAAELAYYGAKVLHPRALIPLAKTPLPLRIRPFADPSSLGTEISTRRTLQKYPVKALSAARDLALLTVTGNGMLGVPGIAARTFEALHKEGVSVSLISQASSEHSICFTVPGASAERAKRSVEDAFREEIARREIDGVELRSGVATLAVVGLGMRGTPGIAAKVFSALADGGINIIAIAQGSSELNISLVVADEELSAALRRIHAAFQLSRIGGGAVTRPDRVDIVLLGYGQIARTLTRLISRVRQPGLSLRIVGVIDRSGFVFDPRGISPRRLIDLGEQKAAGETFASLEHGRAAVAADAIGHVARHALARPILVDLTAADTGPLLRRALAAGLDLVLANKRPLSGPRSEWRALRDATEGFDRRVLYETTVGAGLPILDTYQKLVESGDRVLRMDGCLSGTLGFLLTEIGRGRRFSESLRKAMERGYTEPDPRDDLSGMDVARKALILGRLIGFPGEMEAVQLVSLVPEVARRWPLADFLARLDEFDEEWDRRATEARAAGRTLRYVASVAPRRISVGLEAVDARSPFAMLEGTDNQVAFTTTRYRTNPLVITGPGAGPAVTAAGVLNDLLKLAAT